MAKSASPLLPDLEIPPKPAGKAKPAKPAKAPKKKQTATLQQGDMARFLWPKPKRKT
jgi:hypothetical protein